MDIALKAGKLDLKLVAKTAVVDAVIWYWFHLVSYQSLFTQEVQFIPAGTAVAMVMGLATGVVVFIMRWDASPKAFRVVMPLLAGFTTAGLLLVSRFGLFQTEFDFVCTALFQIACVGCQILRLENLAKCPNIRTLTAALVGSFVLFYVLSFAVLVGPSVTMNIFAILAPLVLIIGIQTPFKPTERVGKVSKKTLVLAPNILMVLFGVAGGFVFGTGNISSATSLEELFVAPPPTFLIMLLLYMELGVIVASGLRFRKTRYFTFVNVTWSLGSLIGMFLLRLVPTIPDSLPVVISAAIVVSFFVFQSTWLEGPKYVVESKEIAAEKLARESGLSNREVEVALLLLEGRSLRYIQNSLYISEGTARTHVKRIYAKLDVHSKQELIDFFQDHAEVGA